MRRMILQMVALVIIGSAVGLTYNAVSPGGIPVKGGKKEIFDTKNVRMMKLDEVQYFLQQPGTVLVDARSIFEYKLGHIPGAVSLPADSFDPVFPKVAPQLKTAKLVIVYCSGGSCGTSEDVAKKLMDHGLTGDRLAIFTDGLPGWMGANLPIKTGEAS
jgi:rhodanese-related sulfurtransferase